MTPKLADSDNYLVWSTATDMDKITGRVVRIHTGSLPASSLYFRPFVFCNKSQTSEFSYYLQLIDVSHPYHYLLETVVAGTLLL